MNVEHIRRDGPASTPPEDARSDAVSDAVGLSNGAAVAGSPMRMVLVRGLHELPVFACMVLFAQVAFLGLRPALCERRRLIEAESEMGERHAHDLELRDRIAMNLRARYDPVFVERQRRLRQRPPLPGE